MNTYLQAQIQRFRKKVYCRPFPLLVKRQFQNRGSIAFEYVMVTLLGIGLSVAIMQMAKSIIYEKLNTLKQSDTQSLDNVWDD